MANERKKRITNLSLKKQIRNSKSVNDLLASDDVNGILKDLEEIKPHISDMIVIYVDKRDNTWHSQITEQSLSSTVVWLLESVKHNEIVGYQDEEE